MNTTATERILRAVKPLPDSLAQEVLDFVDFIKTRHSHDETRNLIAAQAQSMAAVGDSADDEVWNHVPSL